MKLKNPKRDGPAVAADQPKKRSKPGPVKERYRQRQNALDALDLRSLKAKEEGAFWSRLREHEAIGRYLARRYGIDRAHGEQIGKSAPTSPVSSTGARLRGRPPSGFEVYESVELTRDPKSGKLPTDGSFPFWETLTRQWNVQQWHGRPEHEVREAVRASEARLGDPNEPVFVYVPPEHPERMFVTRDGDPDWRTFRKVYLVAAARLEARAAAIFEAHRPTCVGCMTGDAVP